MHLHRVLALAIIVLLSFGLGNTTAIAQTNYQFEAIFNAESTGEPIKGGVLRVSDVAESTNAPYGLTKIVNNNYALSETGILNPDPTAPIKGTWLVKGSFQTAS